MTSYANPLRHFDYCPQVPKLSKHCGKNFWAVKGNWTLDLFLTKEVLYHWATTASNTAAVADSWVKSGRRGSNSPPIAWKAIALPNELLPQFNLIIWKCAAPIIIGIENVQHSFQTNQIQRTSSTWRPPISIPITIGTSNQLISKSIRGQRRIRTSVLVREQIYSLSPLATRPSTHFT